MENTSESVLSRLSVLPVVTSACNWGSHYYDSAKSSNALLKKTFETAEASLKFAVNKAGPVIMKLEKPIAAVDSLACKALSKLQENYPVVNKTPEEISAETKAAWASMVPSRYANLKEYGIQKLNAVKDYSELTALNLMATRYGQVATSTANGALQKANTLLDYFLPSETENETQLDADDTVGTKLKKLSSKLGSRTFAKAQQFETFQKMQASSVSTYQILHGYADLLQMKTKLVWNEFNKELDATEKVVTCQVAKARSIMPLKTEKSSDAAELGMSTLTAS